MLLLAVCKRRDSSVSIVTRLRARRSGVRNLSPNCPLITHSVFVYAHVCSFLAHLLDLHNDCCIYRLTCCYCGLRTSSYILMQHDVSEAALFASWVRNRSVFLCSPLFLLQTELYERNVKQRNKGQWTDVFGAHGRDCAVLYTALVLILLRSQRKTTVVMLIAIQSQNACHCILLTVCCCT